MSESTGINSIQLLRRLSFSEWGGTETVVFNSVKKLIEKQNPTKIFCTSALDKEGQEVVDNISIQRFGYFYPNFPLSAAQKAILDKKGGNPFSLAMYKAMMSEKHLDIIHSHTMGRLAALAMVVAKKRRIPYIVSLHGGHFNVPQAEIQQMVQPTKRTFNWGRFIDYAISGRDFLKNADGIITVGYEESLEAKKQYPDKKVLYLPNGINIDKFDNVTGETFRTRHNIAPDTKIVLCVSRIDYQKNQMLLLDLANRIKNEDQKYKIVLIGPVTAKAYYQKMREFIEKNNLHEHVLIIEGLSPESVELKSAYKAANIFVLPSIHEPFGIVILEAWLAGAPVIASNVGGIKHLVTHEQNALLFDPEKPNDLFDKFTVLNSTPNLSAEIIRSATSEVMKYSWDNIVDRLRDFYLETIRDHH